MAIHGVLSALGGDVFRLNQDLQLQIWLLPGYIYSHLEHLQWCSAGDPAEYNWMKKIEHMPVRLGSEKWFWLSTIRQVAVAGW
jgi:hypothetical protein